ncbi:RsmE family RNA methyltransferase [Gracilimonas amylolytica]|uniref:RsmE family RNA methyltransferase n=1 Tax=Gracilimonas amylolytica TaxID=1749045 RepID=UPI000CD9C398|nr:RsmE family RNA methyltransferase [Gracilimonas amylolytica]
MEIENLFYTEPATIVNGFLTLEGQEARHAAKVMRFREGDTLHASDGLGNTYESEVTELGKNSITAKITETIHEEQPLFKKSVAFGAIKKRDRLEFAVEKAVELGAWEICIFHADHSERSKINQERLQTIALSAFKQCKRSWLPKVVFIDSLDEVMDHYEDHQPVMAYMQAEAEQPSALTQPDTLFLIGPEGGFSEREVGIAKERKAKLVTLGKYRLRAETAVLTILAQYLFT